MPRYSAPALAPLAPKGKQGHCAHWRPPGARLILIVMAHVIGTSRGLAPREGLELELMKVARAGPPLEPRRRPQAGKSGEPRS